MQRSISDHSYIVPIPSPPIPQDSERNVSDWDDPKLKQVLKSCEIFLKRRTTNWTCNQLSFLIIFLLVLPSKYLRNYCQIVIWFFFYFSNQRKSCNKKKCCYYIFVITVLLGISLVVAFSIMNRQKSDEMESLVNAFPEMLQGQDEGEISFNIKSFCMKIFTIQPFS